ncbi:MAG: enoyl-CoA hydratase/isomerase family protein [Actinobacteria bacterium]|nr:enoyl-CoA hydratase/isomerase family protein [Actinomycetota bacterium]
MSLIEYSVEGAVALLTLNRPPVNALSAALVADLESAVARAADPAVRAVVVTGSPHFAAGADIGELKAAAAADETPLAGRLSAALVSLEGLPKPTIAAIRGFALGGGLELALACDFRYLAADARVGLPEIRLGIFPGAGGTQRLPRLVGLGKARELIYTGRHVKADEALAIGLADMVVPADDLAAAALEGAAALAAGATAAIGAAKRAINATLGLSMEAGLAVENAGFNACLGTEDAAEGLAAFLEKREPAFKGR